MNKDLKERLLEFSISIIKFSKSIKLNTVLLPLVSQMIRSSTSVGANYMEAVNGSSRKDFRNKIFICKKEIQETKYWLAIIINTYPEYSNSMDPLLKEATELNLIFQSIANKLK